MSRKDIPDGMVLYAMVQAKADGRTKYAYDLLTEWTGEPEKVCYAAMLRADKHGLIEYGVSLRTGWLTPKGEEVLKAWEQERELARQLQGAERVLMQRIVEKFGDDNANLENSCQPPISIAPGSRRTDDLP